MFDFLKRSKTKLQSIDPKIFAEMTVQPDHIILDVRTHHELAEGHIPDYTMICYLSPNFEQEISRLDKSKTYLVYCRSGKRSAKACILMSRMGFSKLYNLEGGIKAWNTYSKNH